MQLKQPKHSHNDSITSLTASVLCSLVLGLACGSTLAAKKPAGDAQPTSDASGDNTSQTTDTKSQDSQGKGSQPSGNSAKSTNTAVTGPIESQILAYVALRARAKDIATFLSAIPNSKKKFLVLDATDLPTVPAYRSFVFQSQVLKGAFCRTLIPLLTEEGQKRAGIPLPTASQISAAAAAVTATLALFKQSKTVLSNTIAISNDALVAAVREQLTNGELLYPSIYPIALGAPIPTPTLYANIRQACDPALNESNVFQRLATLEYLREQAAEALASLTKSVKVTKSKDDQAFQQTAIDDLNSASTTFDSLIKSLSASNANNDTNGWDQIQRGEQLFSLLADNPVVAVLKLQSAGGETVTVDGAFFLRGAKYYYSGGVIVTALVFDAASGNVAAAKNFWALSGDHERRTLADVSDATPAQ